MPDYRAAVIENGRETHVRVGTLESVVEWAEVVMIATGATTVKISKIDNVVSDCQ